MDFGLTFFHRLKTRLMFRGPLMLRLHYTLMLALMAVLFAGLWLRPDSAGDAALLQWGIVAASLCVLLAEAVLLLLPDQCRLQENLIALRDSKAELERSHAQLLHISNHDGLTGLPNRQRLVAELGRHMREHPRRPHIFAVIGLDGFKPFNDSMGHDLGDHLLMAVGRSLQSCVDDDHIVARIDGDEFALLSDEPPRLILPRIQAVFANPFDLGGRLVRINASIGYLMLDETTEDPLSVLADADLALQAAKDTGGQRAVPFTAILRDQAGQMQSLQMELPDAIRRGELEPWFQPQIRLQDGGLHGVEVLARWRHPTRGMLTPDRFLPAAERAGLMVELDHAIWGAAMGQAVQWQKADLWRPVLSLNAAPDTISDPYLIEKFLLSLRKSGLSVDQIIVEVLETTVIDGAGDMAAMNIDSLSECGVGLELDDFGTGYASLSRLTQLPLSGIKLDRSLIAPLPDQGADSIVRAILALAAELGLHVVAEGVEDTGQARHLMQRGCEIAQGYGYARPMSPQEFRDWLQTHAAHPVEMLDSAPPVARQA
jgi:diguanylate cyclase (GGDEF)-like protein